jgi:D-aminopeptidase
MLNSQRPRARDLGLAPGIFSSGLWNAITDVVGVKVGQVTVTDAENVRSGVTAILCHSQNIFQQRVPAGIAIANGFGKLIGMTQVQELGEIETPLVLTNTLSAPEAAAGIIDWSLQQPGNENILSVNPVVGETNDGYINNIRRRFITRQHAIDAISQATVGPVVEGSVGAGTGTRAFSWKGGIGTSSRILPAQYGGFTLGVLVQTNYGGSLTVLGVPVGVELGRYYLKETPGGSADEYAADGSVMIVVATDAPLSDRNLRRLASRSLLAVAITGSPVTNGSGDYAVAFSTAESVRRTVEPTTMIEVKQELPNDLMSPLFRAAVECTEEAIYNSLLKATTVVGVHTVEAIPIDDLLGVMRRYRAKPA